MVDFINRSASILSVGGKDYAPGAVMPLSAAQVKDATVDFWKREGFITEKGDTDAPRGGSTPVYIPTVEESLNGASIRMTDVTPPPQPIQPEPVQAPKGGKG